MNYLLQTRNAWSPVPFNFGSTGGNTTWLLAYGNAQASGNSSMQGLYTMSAPFLNGSEQSNMWGTGN
jgi:hypothetical protein